MSEKKEKKEKKKLIKKLKHKYRLVVMNDASFEEKWSFMLSPLNVFTAAGSLIIITITLTWVLISFTGLRDFIPGYADNDIRMQAFVNAEKQDDMEQQLAKNNQYVENLKIILNGGTPSDTSMQDHSSTGVVPDDAFINSSRDSLMKSKIEAEDSYNVVIDPNNQNTLKGVIFFPPLKGDITSSFNNKKGHFGIDISAPENESIKATLEGTVIFAGWTSDAGHVIQVQHSNNFISVYKHNSVLLKKVGNIVKAGDPIAIIGNTGKHTDGPHLHFEIWESGRALDPQKFVVF